MEFNLQNIKADRTNPETAFTAQLVVDGKAFMDIVKVHEEHWPDMNYVKGYPDAEAMYNRVTTQVQQLGNEHLYAFTLSLYATRQREAAANAAATAAEQKLRKLCLDYLVIKLPRHKEGEYMLSGQVKAELMTTGKKKTTIAAAIGSETHKRQVRELFAEVMGEEFAQKIEFYNDRYQTEQGTLRLVA